MSILGLIAAGGQAGETCGVRMEALGGTHIGLQSRKKTRRKWGQFQVPHKTHMLLEEAEGWA